MQLKSVPMLVELMKATGLSQARLAAQAEPCTQQRISQLLADPTAVVVPDLAERLARALDVKVTVLFREVETARTASQAGSECEQPSTRGRART